MRVRAPGQTTLFDTSTQMPNGFVYRPDFITLEEEAELIAWFQDLPFETMRTDEGYESKRRHIGFGWEYDFLSQKMKPGAPLPPFLQPFARRIAKWVDIPAKRVVEALISEYTPGSAIGWHRDNEPVEHIVGISLAGWCRMRLRPYSWRERQGHIALPLEPRSAYLMQKDSRWRYQHSIARVSALRYSITFRTLPA